MIGAVAIQGAGLKPAALAVWLVGSRVAKVIAESPGSGLCEVPCAILDGPAWRVCPGVAMETPAAGPGVLSSQVGLTTLCGQ